MAYNDELNMAQDDPNIPKVYINGFTIGLGTTDVSILLKLNNRPALVLNVPYTIAKTLVEKLGTLVVNFEDLTENRILTTDQINKLLASADEEEE